MGVKIREKPKDSGVWWVFIHHNTIRKSKKIGDKKLASEVAAKLQAKLTLGDFDLDREAPARVPTFGEYADLFLGTYSRLHHKQKTIDSYKGILDNHVRPVFGKRPLNEITRKDIKAFIANKQAGGLAPNTVRIIRSYMSAVMTQAVDDEIISVNPVAKTGRYIKKVDGHGQVDPFTWEEKAALESAIKDHFPRYCPFFICALRTGMREGELIALKPGDIDFRGDFIEVRRNCVRGRITTPKSGKTRRVDMSEELSSVQATYMVERKKEALHKGWGEPPEWLFYNENGGMIDVSHMRSRVFYKCLEKAGLRRIRFHDLRHTVATLRIQAGHNIADVSRQLGHSSIRVTIDIYYHWVPGVATSEVNDLDSKTAPKRTPGAPGQEEPMKKGLAMIANPS
jgi:integrase